MNEARIWVKHPGGADRCSGEAVECKVGTDVRIDPRDIQDFSCGVLERVEQDLVLLAGVIAFADRRVTRSRADGWTRTIRMSLPVSDPALWSSELVSGPLRDALRCITGDHWDIAFRHGFRPFGEQGYLCELKNVSDVVIPFSNGMDSILQWHLQSRASTPMEPLRVRVRTGSEPLRDRALGMRQCLGTGACLSIPLRLSVGNHPESSYRTRTFVFFTLAALAASRLDLNRVLVGENGISTLGPPLVPYGNEHNPLGTHPRFTKRLAAFLNALLDKDLVFEHPQLFNTKGAVLKRVSDAVGNGILGTRSCVRDARAGVGERHCGVCCGCLLRRVSLNVVGKRDQRYTWDDLSGRTLAECPSNSLDREQSANDEDIARHAIHIMQSVADLGRPGPRTAEIQRCAKELSACDPDRYANCANAVRSLFETSRNEWEDFKNQFGQGSLLRCYERN